jgi:PAS domain S-box-containing protein/putative nucleotidyltransferase with HDIG domain
MITEELTTGGVFIEAVNKRQDGSLFPCEVSTRLITMENQQRVLVYVHDITARKHAEQALKESEQRYRQIVEASPLGIYTYELDDDDRLIFVGSNPAADKVVGVESAQFLGLTLEDAFPPLAETDVPAHYRRAAREGIPWETEEIQYKYGKIGGIFQTFAFQTGKNQVTVMFQDVTERKLAEQTLQEQTEELETLFTVSTALRAARSTEEMLPMVLKQMRQVLNADAGAVALLDATQSYFTITLSDGDLIANTGRKFKSTEGLSGKVFCTHQPSVVEDIIQEPGRLPGIIGENAIGPEAIVPLLSETEMMGVLIAERKKGRPPFSLQETRLLSALGEMVGNALRRTRLYEQALSRQTRLQALHNIDLAITSSVDQRVTLDVLLSEVVTHLKVDAADVLLFDPQTHMLEYVAGRGMHSQQNDKIRLGDGLAGRIAAEHRVMGAADLSTSNDIAVYRSSLAEEKFQAYYGAPMISKGIVIGVLEVFHRTPIDANPDWVEFLEAVATQAAIAIDNVRLFDGLQRANLDLSLAYDATIEGWSRALDMRDKETEGHTLRVTEITMQLARTLRVDETKLVHIRRGSLLHDIGKMGVADSILLKPGPLTESEWEIMRRHPKYAHEMLHPIAYLRPAIDIPYCHHERWDGSGYPRGLKKGEIPLSARIFAIVDVWDALTSDRPYRSAWPRHKAVEYIQENSGIQFDPLITSIFLEKYA